MSRLSPAALALSAVNHPWRMVAVWVGILAIAVVLITTLLGDSLTTEATPTNNPESVQALDLLRAHDVELQGADELLIVESDKYRVGSAQFTTFLRQVVVEGQSAGAVPAVPGVDAKDFAGKAAGATLRQIAERLPTSEDRTAVLIPLKVVAADGQEVAKRLVAGVEQADRDPDFAVSVTGVWTTDYDLNALSQSDLKEGELYFGLPVALVVLLLVFGTLVGALLPVVLSFVAIICALGLAALVGTAWDLSLFIVNMISAVGLALGIDYSLFVLARYREERERGSDRDAAIAACAATANRAVLFSGLTFIVALVGMLLVPTTIMRSLALGAILVGIGAVAAALTLLPALLRLLGDRVNALALPLVGGSTHPDAVPHGIWARIVGRVMRRPLLWASAVTLLMLAAASPVATMQTGAAGISTMPRDTVSRQGYDAVQRNFSQFTSDPARVVVESADASSPKVQASLDRLTEKLTADDRFGSPQLQISRDNALAVVSVPVGTDSLSPQAVEAVRDLRSEIVPSAFDNAQRVYVTGETAFNVDYFDVMRTWLPITIVFVLALSFILLTVMFRSIVVPIKAIILNLLSVGATYGLLVLVFQHGIGNELLGVQQVETIEAWVPLFLFSILFGLSMDYHMFLLTRIREHWAATGDTAAAVVYGVGSTGRLITGAALIIIAVFVGFASGELVMFQQIGFGVAVALLLDATLVRGVLLPAAMVLLGDRNWYLPRRLRWLPELQLEGAPEGPAHAATSRPATKA